MTTETSSQPPEERGANASRSSPRSGPGPVRRIAGAVFSLLQTRVELVGIELAEERERLFSVFFLGFAAMTLATLALTTLTALVAIVFWNTYRWQALAVITVVYALAALFCALRARRRLRSAPPMFQATLSEFEKDRELFRKL